MTAGTEAVPIGQPGGASQGLTTPGLDLLGPLNITTSLR